jgi:hypothetical protein
MEQATRARGVAGQVTTERNWNPARAGADRMGSMCGLDVYVYPAVRARFGFGSTIRLESTVGTVLGAARRARRRGGGGGDSTLTFVLLIITDSLSTSRSERRTICMHAWGRMDGQWICMDG